jgi:hypothetical protein
MRQQSLIPKELSLLSPTHPSLHFQAHLHPAIASHNPKAAKEPFSSIHRPTAGSNQHPCDLSEIHFPRRTQLPTALPQKQSMPALSVHASRHCHTLLFFQALTLLSYLTTVSLHYFEFL